MAAPAPSNVETVRLIAEVAGEVPGSGTMTLLALGSWEANTPTTRTKTQNNTANGLVADNPATSKTGTGSANFDYTTHGYQLIEEGLGGAYHAAYLHAGSGITATATGNKLVLASGTWTAGLEAGDEVLVIGMANGVGKNGAKFLARVLSAPSGVNLPLDPAYKVLVDEAAVGTLTVYHDGYQVWNRQTQTEYAAEHFNAVSGVGNLDRGVMFTGLTQDFAVDTPVKCTASFRLNRRENIAAAVGLATATPANAPGAVWSSGPNFGAALFPEWGFGFRYNDELLDDVGKMGLKLDMQNPAKGSRVIDKVEDDGGYRDEQATATVELMVKRDGTANAETILADAEDVNTVVSIAFGFYDGVNLVHYSYPQLQPSQETANALANQGEGSFKITYMARDAGAPNHYRRKTIFLPR